MSDNDDNGSDQPKIIIPRWRDGVVKAIYDEALRVTREIDPEAKHPMNAIFSGMVAALYRPAPQQIQMVPGKIVPVHDLLGRPH